MRESIRLSIQTLWASGRCLTDCHQKKRRNSCVCIFVYCRHNAPHQSYTFFYAGTICHFQTSGCWQLLSPFHVSPVFLTGSDRVPFRGMKSIKMTVAALPNATELALPESLTCHFLLLLPIYPSNPLGSTSTMHTRLLQAINNKSGLGKEKTASGP